MTCRRCRIWRGSRPRRQKAAQLLHRCTCGSLDRTSLRCAAPTAGIPAARERSTCFSAPADQFQSAWFLSRAHGDPPEGESVDAARLTSRRQARNPVKLKVHASGCVPLPSGQCCSPALSVLAEGSVGQSRRGASDPAANKASTLGRGLCVSHGADKADMVRSEYAAAAQSLLTPSSRRARCGRGAEHQRVDRWSRVSQLEGLSHPEVDNTVPCQRAREESTEGILGGPEATI